MNILKLKTLLLVTLLSTATLFAGFQNVHCDNENNLTILNITQGDCLALESFWDAAGQGSGWISEQDPNLQWDKLVSAEEWYGITLWDVGGVKWLIPRNNNITGIIPTGIVNFTNPMTLSLAGNNFSGDIPISDINGKPYYAIDFGTNSYTGSLPKLSNLPNLIELALDENNFTGSIPTEYSKLTKIQLFNIRKNKLSGALPNFSDWNDLSSFRISVNNFTFSDIEPQIDYIKNVSVVSYANQADINETEHIVYFDDTLRIEPRLDANPSKHDYYIWKKDGASIEDSNTYTNEDFSQSRIYVKNSATQADEGCYSYDVNNSKVTLPDGSGLFRNLVLHSSTCIQAIYEHAPVVDNLTPSLTTSENITYTYTSAISDADNDTLTVTASSLPSWLTLTSDASSFSLNGTPTFNDAGSYDINITVTDDKIPVHINYILIVQENIPEGYTIGDNTYTHTATGTSIGVGSPYYYSFPAVDDNDDIGIHSTHCDTWRNVYERLTTSGVLTTGYFNNCAGDTESPTLSTAYPLGSKATFIEEPNSAEHQPMIMVDIPLTDATPSITIGGN